MKKRKQRTTSERIASVVGNGPFETEDVVYVQALAQLGARVLEILAAPQPIPGREMLGPDDQAYSRLLDIEDAARSLGLPEGPWD